MSFVLFIEMWMLANINFQGKGTNEGWNGRAFWWPVLVAPKHVPKTIYASKIAGEKVVLTTN